MSLRIVYGRAGSGKTSFIIEDIKSKIEEQSDNPLVLLVPEQFSFQAERNLISAVEAGGILKTEVLSFQRMAYRIFNEAGGITYPHIHPAGKAMILYRILDKTKDQLKVFSKACEKQGFIDTLTTLITEFKRYGVTSEMLEKAVDDISEDNPLKDKLQELNFIYNEFELILAQRYRDSDDDLTMAAKKLSQSSLYKGADIWIDGFINFTPQEYKMISVLLSKAKRVTISLCADKLEDSTKISDTDVFSPVKSAYRKLVHIANESKTPIEKPVILGEPPVRFRQSPELAHLEKNLYAFPYKTLNEETKNISLFSAINIYTEIETAATDIIRLCRDNNMRFRDIAVVTRNLPAYEKLIEVIFSEYNIPYFIDRKIDINNHPLVRLIISMMDIFIENWSYEAVFRYLKTGLTGIDQGKIDQLENYVLACGIRGNKWIVDKKWDMSVDLIPEERESAERITYLDEIDDTRKKVIEPLMEFRDKTKGRKSAVEYCKALYEFLCSLKIPEKIEGSIVKFREQGFLDLANEYSQVWNIVMDVLDQAVEVMGDQTFGIEPFSSVLKIGLGEYKIGTIPAALDQVLVGSVERSKSHEIKALYILGVNDGVFPSTATIEGVLSDQDRLALNNIGIELASDTRTQAFDEQYLVYQSLTTAGKYLRISWPIGDSEGKTLRPSIIVSRLKKLFPRIKIGSNVISASNEKLDMELISEKVPTFKKLITALRQKADQKEINPFWEDVYSWFFNDMEWRKYCETAKEAFMYKNEAQKISGEKIRLLYGEPVISSASRVEKYVSCPFAFYIQYGLGAKERKIYRLSPPDIGTFMHTVIERFSALVSEGEITWRNFDKEWCNNQVSKIVDEMLEKMRGAGIAASMRYTALTVRLKRVVARSVWMIAEHIRRSSFNPIDYEVDFGENGKYPPIVIELDHGKRIQLRGRIDRIDAFKTEDGTYLNIIDYKSGTKDFRLSDVYYGLQIQLMTYMDAIWESEEQKGNEKVLPGGMLYFKVDDPIIKDSKNLTQEDIENAIMKKLKMKGIVMADVKVIKAMDNTIEGASKIIPATLNKNDELGKNTSGATEKQFRAMRKHIRGLLKDIGTEIVRGNVEIKPYKKKGINSCTYCSFHSVCQFDTTRQENSFRLLFDKSNDEVWDIIGGKQDE